MTQYWEGHKTLFLTNSLQFEKYGGGGARAPLHPYSAVPVQRSPSSVYVLLILTVDKRHFGGIGNGNKNNRTSIIKPRRLPCLFDSGYNSSLKILT